MTAAAVDQQVGDHRRPGHPPTTPTHPPPQKSQTSTPAFPLRYAQPKPPATQGRQVPAKKESGCPLLRLPETHPWLWPQRAEERRQETERAKKEQMWTTIDFGLEPDKPTPDPTIWNRQSQPYSVWDLHLSSHSDSASLLQMLPRYGDQSDHYYNHQKGQVAIQVQDVLQGDGLKVGHTTTLRD